MTSPPSSVGCGSSTSAYPIPPSVLSLTIVTICSRQAQVEMNSALFYGGNRVLEELTALKVLPWSRLENTVCHGLPSGLDHSHASRSQIILLLPTLLCLRNSHPIKCWAQGPGSHALHQLLVNSGLLLWVPGHVYSIELLGWQP